MTYSGTSRSPLFETLDDAAQVATDGLRLEAGRAVATARRSAAVRRRRLVRRAAVAAAAVAASVTVLMVLAPGLGRLVTAPLDPAGRSRQAVTGPVGIPDRMWAPPAWTPLVTDDPIPSVGVVLLDAHASLYVVSSDGRAYRRLPGTGDDAGRVTAVAVSPDGTQLAWSLERTDLSAAASASASHRLQVLRLGDARVRTVALPDDGLGTRVTSLTWRPDGSALLVRGELTTEISGSARRFAPSVWTVPTASGSTGSSSSLVCRGCVTALLASGDGRDLVQVDDGTPPAVDAQARRVTDRTVGRRWSADMANGTPQAVCATGCAQVAGWVPSSQFPPETWALRLLTPGADASPRQVVVGPSTQIVDASLLGWDARGVLVRLTHAPVGSAPGRTTIERVDAATGVRSVVSTVSASTGSWAMPIAVSAQVANTSAVVTGTPPTWPWWQPERLRAAVQDLFSGTSLVVLLGLLALLAVAGLALFPLLRNGFVSLAGRRSRSSQSGPVPPPDERQP